jgi:hypothetical protein
MGNKKGIARKRKNSTRCYPSQGMEGSTQVSKTGVLIPIELRNMRGRCRGRCYSIGNGGGGFAWSYTIRVSSSNDRLRWNKKW